MAAFQTDMAGTEDQAHTTADIDQDVGYDDGGIAETDEFGRSLELLKWRPVNLAKLPREQREVCHELFRRGDMSWFLHPEQEKLLKWLDEKHRDLACICMSRQWGKSTFILAYAICYCLTHPKSSVLFIAPFRTQVETAMESKINTVFQFLPDDALPSRRGLIWTFPNGSIFRLDGIAIGKGTRMRGDTVNLCIIDECRDVRDLQATIEGVISPMLSTTEGRLVLISTPPESPLHAFTQKYIKESLVSKDFYTATYKQNPLLSTKRLRTLMNVTYKGGEQNIVFRREFMADWTVADPEKRVVREWDQAANDKFFLEYEGPPKVIRGYVGLDYAWNDPCGIVMGYYDYAAGCLIIEDEYFERGRNTDEVGLVIKDMEKRLHERHPGLLEPIRIMDIDPSLMADFWARYNLRFEPAMKVPSAVTMLNRLRSAFIDGKIRIRTNCVNLRFQLAAGVFNASGSDYARTQTGGHLDCIDALKYLVLNLRWNEVFGGHQREALGANQIRIGGFAPSGSFRDGIIHRPGRM